MNKTTKWIVGIVVVVIIVFVGYYVSKGPSQPTSTEPIKIGVVAPFTGDAGALGENVKVAIEIARDEINQAGGVNGRDIQVIFEDGKCNGKDAANAATKLINIDKVLVVMGMCSAETLAIAPLAEQAKVLLISPSSTNAKVTTAGDYVFRFIPSDSFQGKFAADYLINTLGKKKIAILYSLNDWATGIKDVFKQRTEEIGGTIVGEEGYQQESRDLRSQIIKLKELNPDAIYFLGYTEATIVGLKQMQELGVTTTIFGGDAWDDPTIPQKAGAAANGARYSIAANQQLPQSFLDEMKKRPGGEAMNSYSPRAYDILKVLAGIISETGDNTDKIKNALYKLKDYQGIADKYSLDANGDIETANFTIKEMQDGVIVEL